MFNQPPPEATAAVQHYRPLAELVPTHWQSGFVTAADGTRIHYTRTGSDKPALLLLHGVQVNGLAWLRTAQHFEDRYDVVMPDFRGHGQTGGLENGVGAGLLVDDTITVMQALKLETPFVVGHSMGADVAGRLAAAAPVRALVLVDPALQNFAAGMQWDVDAPPPWMVPIFETIRALKTQSHAERMVSGLNLLMPGAPVWGEADYVAFVEGQAQFDLDFFRHIDVMGSPLFESPDVIARIACPTLLLTARSMMPGANPAAGLAAFLDNLRDVGHVQFDDSGHFIMADQFERFAQVVEEFLNAH